MKYYQQETPYTCGAACLRMMLSEFRDYSERTLAALSRTIHLGATPLDLASAARELGYKASVYKNGTFKDLNVHMPCIVLINPGIILQDEPTRNGHYVIIKRIEGEKVIVNDPAPIFGGEDKEIDKKTFVDAWEIMNSWIIKIGGDKE